MMSPDSAKWLEAMKSKMGSMYENKVCAGEHSNFKKNPTNTQDHGDAQQREARVCPRTLVDPKRKRQNNAVDVVVRLHDPTDPSTKSEKRVFIGYPKETVGYTF